MKKLVRFARGYGKNIALVILLLAVQAFCDLSLPNYTSKIVDVGIQNSGIEHITPEEIRTDSMDLLQLFMTEDEVSLINSRYEEKEGGLPFFDAQRSKCCKSQSRLVARECLE